MKQMICALPECGKRYELLPGRMSRHCSPSCASTAGRLKAATNRTPTHGLAIVPRPRPSLELHCSICARRFVARLATTRTCSPACTKRLSALVRGRRRPAPRGLLAMVLGALRAAHPEAVTSGALAAAIYGIDDGDGRDAIRMHVFRLRGLYGSDGLVIETSGAGYKLARDLDERAEAAL
jgi:hypothetical protein